MSKQTRSYAPGRDKRNLGHLKHPNRASFEHESRMAALFRKWPTLDAAEMRELRELWDERVGRLKRRIKAKADLAA